MKIDKLKKGQSKIQRDRKEIVSKKEQLNHLISSEKSKYHQVKEDVLKHEKSVKAAVERYFKELRDELDQKHNSVSNTIKSDLNAVSVILKKADNKSNEVNEFVQISDASKFFIEVNNLEKSIDIQMPKLPSSYVSIPNFVQGEITQSNIGVLEFDENSSHEPHINLEINKQYQTELVVVEYVCSSMDQSFWITSGKYGKYGIVHNVKPGGTKLKILSSYNTRVHVYGMAVTQSNNVLISTGDSRLKQISSNTGTLTDSVYNMPPFLATSVHITSNNKFLVGCGNKDRRVVILMNHNGDHERVYEHDQHKQPIFTGPMRITSTSNGNIHVVDKVSGDRGRVVVLGQDGDIINIYTRDSEINKDIQFTPLGIVTTPRDNVIIADVNTDTLHILNNAGLLMTYYKTSDINIVLPMSLAFSPTGQLFIGCSRPKGNTTKEAKLYDVTISGC